MMMVALYYNPQATGFFPGAGGGTGLDYFDASNISPSGYPRTPKTRDGRIAYCPTSAYINFNAPAGKKDFMPASMRAYGADQIVQAVIRSLAGGDPVVMYWREGGIIRNSKHIVVIVGYDPNDKPEQGGTFYVHDPYRYDVKPFTKFSYHNGVQLTAAHWKRWNGDASHGHSVSIRRAYLPRR